MISIHGVRLGAVTDGEGRFLYYRAYPHDFIRRSGSGLAGFTGPLGDFGDSRFEDFQLGISRTDGKGLVFDTDDDADDAAAGHNFVATAEGLHQGIVFLGLALLRADEHEIEDKNHQKEREKLDIPRRTPSGLLARLRPHGKKRIGKADYHKNSIT